MQVLCIARELFHGAVYNIAFLIISSCIYIDSKFNTDAYMNHKLIVPRINYRVLDVGTLLNYGFSIASYTEKVNG